MKITKLRLSQLIREQLNEATTYYELGNILKQLKQWIIDANGTYLDNSATKKCLKMVDNLRYELEKE